MDKNTNGTKKTEAEKIPSVFQWYVKKLENKSKEKLDNQLKLDGWLLALAPVIYFVANLIFDDGLSGLFIMSLCACIMAYEVAIIKYIKKEQWIRHPLGLLICGFLFSVGTGIYWLFVKKKHLDGTTEQKKVYSLQATVGAIVLGGYVLIAGIVGMSTASVAIEQDYCDTHRCVENILEGPSTNSKYAEREYIRSHCSPVCMTFADNIAAQIQNTEMAILNQGPRFSKVGRCSYGRAVLNLFRQSQQACPSVSDCLTSEQKAKISQYFGDC